MRPALQEIIAKVRELPVLIEEWASEEKRAARILVLFAGPDGPEKTVAAQMLAKETGRELFRLDLGSVVSKYIGETEKNLQRLFAAAEDGGAILFFDEADALFSKRAEVQDAHDRYANIEINYLLQRLESYRGLAIIATNDKQELPDALLRCIHVMVEFPLPGSRR